MNEIENIPTNIEVLYANIKNILARARRQTYHAINFTMVESYWMIGQTIVEHEQHGKTRAAYGKKVLKELADRLTVDFGKGFDERELRKMRQFYLAFQIRDTLRPELTGIVSAYRGGIYATAGIHLNNSGSWGFK